MSGCLAYVGDSQQVCEMPWNPEVATFGSDSGRVSKIAANCDFRHSVCVGTKIIVNCDA